MPAYCVLGMHRSGTSCVAGTLEEAGVHLGGTGHASESNARGDREDPVIVRLHREVLRSSGGTWHSPPRQVRWEDRHRAWRDDIIREREGRPAWGFKDPRTLLTLEGWLEALPDLRIAGVFRHPRAVARSIAARDGFSMRKGLRLWTLYNERLLLHAQARRFPLISFDLEEEDFRERLSLLLAKLGLETPGGLRFFEAGLRNEDSEGPAIPRRASELHAALVEMAL